MSEYSDHSLQNTSLHPLLISPMFTGLLTGIWVALEIMGHLPDIVEISTTAHCSWRARLIFVKSSKSHWDICRAHGCGEVHILKCSLSQAVYRELFGCSGPWLVLCHPVLLSEEKRTKSATLTQIIHFFLNFGMLFWILWNSIHAVILGSRGRWPIFALIRWPFYKMFYVLYIKVSIAQIQVHIWLYYMKIYILH